MGSLSLERASGIQTRARLWGHGHWEGTQVSQWEPGPQMSVGGSLVTAPRCHERPQASARSEAGGWKGVGSGFGAERWF